MERNKHKILKRVVFTIMMIALFIAGMINTAGAQENQKQYYTLTGNNINSNKEIIRMAEEKEIASKQVNSTKAKTSVVGEYTRPIVQPSSYFETQTRIGPSNDYSPAYGGYDMYCIQHGMAFPKYPISETNPNDVKYTRSSTRPAPHSNRVPQFESMGTRTYGKNSRMAYIITYPEIGNYVYEKQQAIWGIENSVYQEGKLYEEYMAQKRVDLEDKTNLKEVKTAVDRPSQDYTIGPFNIDYTKGDYNSVVFAGISDIYLIGLDKEGNVIKDRIDITSFIANNMEKEFKKFDPIESDGYVDRKKQEYPKPKEDFYLKFKNPNQNNEGITNVKIHIEYEWMEATEASSIDYDGKEYPWQYELINTRRVYDNKGKYKYTEYTWRTTDAKILEPIDQQNVTVITKAKRTLYKQEIDITPEDEEGFPITMELGGIVWKDEPKGKEGQANGVKDAEEILVKGAEVILYDKATDKEVIPKIDADSNRKVTDENGEYLFKEVDSMKEYYVKFLYDGMRYQHTYYTDHKETYEDTQNRYSHATETSSDRGALNLNFKEIGSTPNNYKVRESLYYGVGEWNKTYTNAELGVAIDGDMYDLAKQATAEGRETNKGNTIYADLMEEAFKNQNYEKATYDAVLAKHGGTQEAKRMLQFIHDRRIAAYTGPEGNVSKVTYPLFEKFIIDDTPRTIAGVYYEAIYEGQRQIDLGLNMREQLDLALMKDIYKATIKINGKEQEYIYNKRELEYDDNTGVDYWNVKVRVADAGYYEKEYSRELFKADYLYNTDTYSTQGFTVSNEKELKIFVTYKITLRNQSLSVLGQINEVVDYYDEEYTFVEAYIGDKSANKTGNVEVDHNTSKYGSNTHTDLSSKGMKPVYVRGGDMSTKLQSGERKYLYITFEVNKEDNPNGPRRVMLDEDINGNALIGKRNIVEINGFESYYKDGTAIPDRRDKSGSISDKTKRSTETVGLNDVDSNPGNLNPNDVNEYGDFNKDTIEDDTDKAPNINIILHKDPEADRTAEGIVWEDERDLKSDAALVGNGKVEDKETKINGVTVQLVELVQGDNGQYQGEYLWKEFDSGHASNLEPVISGFGAASIPSYSIGEDGKYKFLSYPAGDYVLKFIYGNKEATVLTNLNGSEVNQLLGTSGRNVKSYNGQDYKSTTYQKDISQSAVKTYNGITGYNNYDTQNVDKAPNQLNMNNRAAVYQVNKSALYNYDFDIFGNGSTIKDVSHSKDYGYRRGEVNNYSKTDVTNHKAEVLASPYTVPSYYKGKGGEYSYNKEEQSKLIEELIQNTAMTSQTGSMNIEIEYNRVLTDDQSKNNTTSYKVQNVNFGLEQRPEAGLRLTKKVKNVEIKLANGTTLFNAEQSVPNLQWVDHNGHTVAYNPENKNNYRMESATVNVEDPKYVEETIIAYMDKEIMHGSTLRATYEITVDNYGEVDYLDNQFYYTGKTNNASEANISKTVPNEIIDYVANNIQYSGDHQVQGSGWEIKDTNTAKGLVNKYINNAAFEDGSLSKQEAKGRLETYNTIVTTKSLGKELLPNMSKDVKNATDKSSAITQIVLSQILTPESSTDSLTYNNISEIIRVSNSQGRRMEFSVVGNQEVASQTTGKNSESIELISPKEIDADSAQKIYILPPTGEDQMTNIIIAVAAAVGGLIIIGGIIFIFRKVLKK